MKAFADIRQLLVNYKGSVALNFFFNVLYNLFNVFSFIMVVPVLDIIFDSNKAVHTLPDTILSIEGAKQAFYYYLTVITEQYDSKIAGLIFIASIVALIFLLKNVSRFFATWFMTHVRNGISGDLRSRIHTKLLGLQVSFFNKSRKGDLLSRSTNDVLEAEYGVVAFLDILSKEPFQIIFTMAALFYISPVLTAYVLLLIIIMVTVVGRIGRSLKKQSQDGQSKLGYLVSLLEESISGIRVIQAFNVQAYKSALFNRESDEYRKIMNRNLRKRYLASPLTEVLAVFIFSSVIILGGHEVLNDKIEPSVFISYIILYANMVTPAKNISTAWYALQRGRGSLARIDEILQTESSLSDKAEAQPINQLHRDIRFAGVSFSYAENRERKVLDNISFQLGKGQLLALVGSSGAGKTTLADLLARFYDVDEGTIWIDDIDIRDYRLHDLRKIMGIVSQEPLLFNDSIYNNIVFGSEGVNREQVIEAAKVANAYDFIMKLEQGFETACGDRGVKLSGGEKQRITIARAVLKNPSILILDEATSSLDSASEKAVQSALQNLMKDRTSIVIAHRLSTIQHADKILVMSAGRIVEEGNHEELIKQEGAYKRLVELQAF